jgi:hypothetical protein
LNKFHDKIISDEKLRSELAHHKTQDLDAYYGGRIIKLNALGHKGDSME